MPIREAMHAAVDRRRDANAPVLFSDNLDKVVVIVALVGNQFSTQSLRQERQLAFYRGVRRRLRKPQRVPKHQPPSDLGRSPPRLLPKG